MSHTPVSFSGTAAELATKVRLNGNAITAAQITMLGRLGFATVVGHVETGKKGRPQNIYELRQNLRGLLTEGESVMTAPDGGAKDEDAAE